MSFPPRDNIFFRSSVCFSDCDHDSVFRHGQFAVWWWADAAGPPPSAPCRSDELFFIAFFDMHIARPRQRDFLLVARDPNGSENHLRIVRIWLAKYLFFILFRWQSNCQMCAVFVFYVPFRARVFCCGSPRPSCVQFSLQPRWFYRSWDTEMQFFQPQQGENEFYWLSIDRAAMCFVTWAESDFLFRSRARTIEIDFSL
jgi:hypothetical protein